MPTFKKSTDALLNGASSNGESLTGRAIAGPPSAEAGEPHSALRPYSALGMDLSVRDAQASGDCPFCGKEGKFTVSVHTGQWRCFTCGEGGPNGGGNATTFLRLLHILGMERSDDAFWREVAADRRLCDPATARAWGVARNPLMPHTWLVPGYGTDGKLRQLYRRTLIEGHHRLIPVPGVWPEGKGHGIHLATSHDPSPSVVYVCEGPWDGMALWEVARASSTTPCQIVAVPGCNVWQDSWSEWLTEKTVVLLFDSDHPRTVGSKTFRAGYDGMRRVAGRLSGRAAEVKWLCWGPDGYDPDRPDGYDLRDALGSAPSLAQRRVIMNGLMQRLADAPPEWFSGSAARLSGTGGRRGTEVQDCDRWATCEAAWKEALCWRQDMSDATAVLLAVCASTQQAGNQLFVDLIGSPGSAKTTICRGLLTSRHCIHLENVTKLVSGFKKPGDETKDCSFIARANGKTWITCEFDTLGSSPQYHELMGKVRRIFDGETSTTYGNSDEDRIYEALRTPWIRAGTQKMIDHDQSQLGDRFLRYMIEDPTPMEKRDIMDSALESELSAMMETANATAGSIVDEKTRKAHALTGGYVDWLRANIESALPRVTVSVEAKQRCKDLAEIVADLRARPNEDRHRKEHYDVKELPSRLAKQNIRLAMHLTVVLNKDDVDASVMRVVRKVALDTAHGHSLNITKWLCGRNHKLPAKSYQSTGGIGTKTLGMWLNMPTERLESYLAFLQRIDVLKMRGNSHGSNMWVLTDRMYDLFTRAMKG